MACKVTYFVKNYSYKIIFHRCLQLESFLLRSLYLIIKLLSSINIRDQGVRGEHQNIRNKMFGSFLETFLGHPPLTLGGTDQLIYLSTMKCVLIVHQFCSLHTYTHTQIWYKHMHTTFTPLHTTSTTACTHTNTVNTTFPQVQCTN